MSKGILIALEGIDGSGKTTLAPILVKRLSERLGGTGTVIQAREPGGTSMGEKIRSTLLTDHDAAPTQLTESLLFFACRAQLLEEVVKPALEQGKWVVLDRFILSTLAYQGAGRGVSNDILESLRFLMPIYDSDLTVYLSMGLDASEHARTRRGHQEDKVEGEGVLFLKRVYDFYEKFKVLKMNDDDFLALDALRGPEELVNDIISRLEDRYNLPSTPAKSSLTHKHNLPR